MKSDILLNLEFLAPKIFHTSFIIRFDDCEKVIG